jgi:hypothetical protein
MAYLIDENEDRYWVDESPDPTVNKLPFGKTIGCTG